MDFGTLDAAGRRSGVMGRPAKGSVACSCTRASSESTNRARSHERSTPTQRFGCCRADIDCRRARCAASPHLHEFLASAIEQRCGWLTIAGPSLDEVSVDSVRVRAHASSNSVRTLSRSSRRLAELQTSISTHDEAEQVGHCEKLANTVNRLAGEDEAAQPQHQEPPRSLLKLPERWQSPAHRSPLAPRHECSVVFLLAVTRGSDHGKSSRRSNHEGMLDRIGIVAKSLAVSTTLDLRTTMSKQRAHARSQTSSRAGNRGERDL